MAAGSWSTTERANMGSLNVLIGTYTATDGADSTAETGLNRVSFVAAETEVGMSHTAGYIEALTATSGGTVKCIVWGS